MQDVFCLPVAVRFSPPLASTPPCGRWQFSLTPLGGLLSKPGLVDGCMPALPALSVPDVVLASASALPCPAGWKAVAPVVPVGWTGDVVWACDSAARHRAAIPNAAASLRQSFTPWYAMPPVTAENKLIVQALFDVCGEAAEVPQEGFIDYCVGMTGSGAAFPALLAQALEAHAVAQGLPADFARRAALGVVVAASQLLAAEGSKPELIVQEMIDYNGTTAAALRAMRDNGFSGAVGAGLDAAAARGNEMALLTKH